jgi:hypothetical protein
MASSVTALTDPYPSNAVITVSHGEPCPPEVTVSLRATVQFVNKDPFDYNVRLRTRARGEHADVDNFLPARGSFTLIVDPETQPNGRCDYELLRVNLLDFVRSATPVGESSWATEKNVVAQESVAASESPEATGTTASAVTASAGSSAMPVVLATQSSHGPGGGTIKIGG